MTHHLPWSPNPNDYRRDFPAWFALYRELSRPRLSPADLAARFHFTEPFVQARRAPGALHFESKDAYSILDVVPLSLAWRFRSNPERVAFLDRFLPDHLPTAWQSLVGAVHGRTVFIAANFDDALVLPYLSAGSKKDDHIGDGMTRIDLTAVLRKIVIDQTWPDFSTEVDAVGRWHFKFKKGYLQLKTLPDREDARKPASPPDTGDRDEHGHRRLTPKNFMTVDPFFKSTLGWKESDPRLRDYVAEILSIEMHPSVPAEVRMMFDLLRNAMVYGFFYRPVFSLLADQVYFIADAAAFHKCKSLKITPSRFFGPRIRELTKRGAIHPGDSFLWDAKASLRNSYAHRTHQSLDWPPNEIGRLRMVAQDISNLFVPLYGPTAPTLRAK